MKIKSDCKLHCNRKQLGDNEQLSWCMAHHRSLDRLQALFTNVNKWKALIHKWNLEKRFNNRLSTAPYYARLQLDVMASSKSHRVLSTVSACFLQQSCRYVYKGWKHRRRRWTTELAKYREHLVNAFQELTALHLPTDVSNLLWHLQCWWLFFYRAGLFLKN